MTDPRSLMKRGGTVIAQRGIARDVQRAAQAQAGYTDTVIWIPRADITIDDAIQVRVGGVDLATVEQYAVVMYESEGWGPFPAVVVFRDGDAFILSAGFQRTAASDRASALLVAEGKAGIDSLPCEVRPGGYAAALEFAEDDNLQHGKPLSTQDKRRMFERRLERGHRWSQMSGRAIAQQIGVDRRTVDRWRDDYEEKRRSRGANAPGAPSLRIGADGKAYDVSKVQESNRERAARNAPPAPPRAVEAEPRGLWRDLPDPDSVDLLSADYLLRYIQAATVLYEEIAFIQRAGVTAFEPLRPDQWRALADALEDMISVMQHRDVLDDVRERFAQWGSVTE